MQRNTCEQTGLDSSTLASVIPGRIMWLPSREQLPTDIGLNDGCYDHPVVILSYDPRDGKVTFCLVSTPWLEIP